MAEFKDVAKSYGDKHVFSGVELHHRARRPHRAGGRERRGQVDADQAAGRRRAAVPPASTTWATTSKPTTSRRTSTRSSTRTRACSTILATWRRDVDADGTAQPARLLPVLRGRCLQAHRRALRRRAQPLRAGAHAAASRRISCCSTSRPTTWTCAPRTCCWKRSQNFTGTVVFVSHDRYFIDKLATRVFEIGDGTSRSLPRQLRRLPVAQRGTSLAHGPAHPCTGDQR